MSAHGSGQIDRARPSAVSDNPEESDGLILVEQTYRVPLYSQTSASVEVQPFDSPRSENVNGNFTWQRWEIYQCRKASPSNSHFYDISRSVNENRSSKQDRGGSYLWECTGILR